jgi:hypothetical protein
VEIQKENAGVRVKGGIQAGVHQYWDLNKTKHKQLMDAH